MSDEFKLRQDASRAARVEALVRDELLEEAFTGLEAAYSMAWRNTTREDVAGREQLFLAINIVGKVRQHFASILNDGKVAVADLRRLAETAERARRWEDVA